MKSNQLSKITFVSLSFLLAACTQPGEKTAIGAATGGAIGAGLGAIVGNQTGSTGGGLAIGAVAGASTGAYIANAMEAQDKGMREQDEAIERQEQTIKAQRAQIEEFRRGSDSKFASGDKFGGPVTVAGRGFDSSKAAPGDLYLSPTGANPSPHIKSSRANFESHGAVSAASPRASSNLNDTAINPVNEPKQIKPALEPEPISEAPLEEADSSKPLLETDLVTSPPAAEPVIAETNSVISNSELQPLNSASLAQGSSTQECTDADAEVRKADQASDAGDKLFHYRRALRLCPRDSKIHAAIGDLYLTLGRKDDAVFEYEEGLKVDPNSASLKSKLSAAKG